MLAPRWRAVSPPFSNALKHRRCLIPADGYYEWKRSGASKQPFCFEVNDGVVRFRWSVGPLARCKRDVAEDFFDPDHHPQCPEVPPLAPDTGIFYRCCQQELIQPELSPFLQLFGGKGPSNLRCIREDFKEEE